ncbi:sensor histidine kinase [Corynebacterium kalidii]|uniref:histidine kinase n=1 Tax=Corynebacterium kalidii TaxID=2931982 RepID=A0A9X1WEK4_9CORY|nr:HAMP domain-containing sensor histidine kinase [Corynebacterium kalidii]MCJ7857584.1 HAMP domain-containing histidine kinase [Corynebacterium kalidii]
MPASLRWQIVLTMSTVVLITVASVVVVTRSVSLAQVSDRANAAVEQELEEFRRFVAQGTDPVTAAPFSSTRRLTEVYLSRQIPDEDELMVGLLDGNLLQADRSHLRSAHPEPLDPSEPLAAKVLSSDESSGILDDPDRGTAHWGRLAFTTGDESQSGQFAVVMFTREDEAAVSSQVRMMAAAGAGGVLVATLLALLVAGRIIAPIRRLQEVSSSISNSDLSRRVPADGPREISRLAETFNDMLDRLETVVNDQRAFVDDAGHELRTPLTVVRGQLELLETSDAESRARSVELATTELDRMTRMVNDLLTLAVADSGSFLHPSPVDIAELMIDIEDKVRTVSDRALLVDAAEGVVVLDEQRVTEAVLELFGNALRYSDDTVEIGSEFRGTGPGRYLRIWVRDRGPGLPPESRESLFRRFSRGGEHAAASARPRGAGLGLSIVKSIAEGHGGRAFVESTVGLGSIFGLDLPAPTGPEGSGTPEEKEQRQ